jgi:hypothetical protein
LQAVTIRADLDASTVIALIALVGSAVAAAATVFGAPVLQSRREARAVLARHRDPLAAAAYELQARLHNILRNRFLETWMVGEGTRQGAAIESTLYVFAQFLAWTEIIRREVQILRFATDRDTRAVAKLLREINETFLTDAYGEQFMIWRVEQRGVGERMIHRADGQPTCMGYAEFIDQRGSMAAWLAPLEDALKNLDDGGRERLTRLQHELLELVQTLDEGRIRYPFELRKV